MADNNNINIKKVDNFLNKLGLRKTLTAEHKAEGEKHKALLVDAIEDLQKDIDQLVRERDDIGNYMKQTGDEITLKQDEETKLKNKIKSLVEQEYQLMGKKSELQEKLDALKSKMSKISKIKDELKEL